jgi:1,4-alpha-glucan branching enzyme
MPAGNPGQEQVMAADQDALQKKRPKAHAQAEDSLPQAEIEAIVRGDHGNPFAVLGLHDAPGGLVARAFIPDARRVLVIDRNSGDTVAELQRQHPNGFFAGLVNRAERFAYRLRQEGGSGPEEFDDPYGFGTILSGFDLYLMGEGSHQRLYDRMGAHPITLGGVAGVSFVVWAPNARRVSVVGDFNGWDGRRHVMRHRESGVWEIFIPALPVGTIYKYEIKSANGSLLPLKADPFAFRAEHPPRTASVVNGIPERHWHDQAWMLRRGAVNAREAPISIYECHLGSWARVPEEGNRYLSYDELGDRLIPYVKDLGFTHIELLPVSEFPFDGSWGYQPVGLFAPTSRFGTPEQFARFVERCHQADLGVIIDWVPGHFPTDAHGLGRFDGTALFEHEDPRQGFHRDWNTLIYNYGRTEVSNFLLSNGLYWLDRYHIDALRVDAVASMLYLDYSRQAGEWIPNREGGRENIEAVAFLRRLNELVFGNHPGATTAAEESTAWPNVSRPTSMGGLGFGYKWNMGWMHDTLAYMSTDAIYRKYHHHQLTFGLLYAFSENFILPLSHDEVVHGKGSLLGKMPGDRWQRFANLRAYYGFMFTHPGKKLLFMGGEFGQEREWNHDRSLDWHLLSDPMHGGLQRLVRDLNQAYRSVPALHQLDCEPNGFEWLDANDGEHSVLAFLRKGFDVDRPAITVCNFTPVPRHGYRIGVPLPGVYREVVNTDAECYGGSNLGNGGCVVAEVVPCHNRPCSLSLTLPPLGTLVLQRDAS